MNRLTATQLRWNQQSAGHGDWAAEHRRRVMHLIEQAAPAAGGRVCIFGAGNCNDLDLPQLTQRLAEVALVDLDADALQQAALRQGVADAASLKLYGGRDLTGVWDELDRVSQAPNQDALLDDLLPRARRPALDDLAAPFDAVISTCVLSQLIHGVDAALGERHPRFVETLAAVRLGHLRLMADLAAPGGRLLLITDFVSSDSAPEIATTAEEDLPALARRLLDARNFFHGLNPAVLASLWRTDPQLAAGTHGLTVAPPWRWDFGVRQYLVTAFGVEKTAR